MRTLNRVLIAFCLFGLACSVHAVSVETSSASDWQARALSGIVASEYIVHQTADGLVANNRAQQMRHQFDSSGLQVRDQIGSGRSVQFALKGFGRDENWIVTDASTPTVHNGRVQYQYKALIEWYRNGPEGLEHGFDLAVRPDGEGELSFAISVDGAVPQRESAHSLLLINESQRFRYDGLKVWDRTGRMLSARMDVVKNDILLRVDDRDAQYPITIDPLLTNAADTTFFQPQATAAFGYDIAVVGDVDGDGFQDTVIAANSFNGPAGTNEGAWFLYLGSAGATNATPDFSYMSGQIDAELGSSVAGVGDVNGDGFADFVVGAELYDAGQSDEGVVLLFLGGAAFNAIPDATLEVNQAAAYFGHSVSGAGDVNGDGYADVVIGANGFDGGATNSGAAFLYLGGAGAFNTTFDATMIVGSSDVRAGSSVAGVGDVDNDGFSDFVVGAPEYEQGAVTETNEGAAFLYRGGVTFNSVADAHYQINQAEARLGTSLSGAGDVNGDGFADIIIGSPRYDNDQTNEGRAYIYFGAAAPSANPVANVTLELTQADADFGAQVESAGDVNGDGYADVLVAAPSYDNGESNEGLVSVYLGGSSFSTTAYKELESNQIDAFSGASLASGDVNRDGYADVLIGMPLFDGSSTDTGQVQLFLGGPLLPDTAREGLVYSGQVSGQHGHSVATGDVNGDGFSDLVVGAYGFDAGQTNSGRVSIYFGSAGGFSTSADIVLGGQLASERFGASVAVGDVNRDGLGDLLIGAPFASLGQTEEGVAYIFLSDAGSFSNPPDVTLQNNQANASFGASVAFAGDINGDGNNDVLVGAPLHDGSLSDQGAMFVYLNDAGTFGPPNFTVVGTQGSEFLGTVVATAGDTNGDGFADIMTSGTGFDATGALNAGIALLFNGGSPFDTDADLVKNGGMTNARFGSGLAAAGDVNGDGFGDIIIGTKDFTVDQTEEGAAFLYAGRAIGVDEVPFWRVESNQVGAEFGVSVAGVGDVNADGFADFVVGSSDFDLSGSNNVGSAFLYLGRAVGFNNTAIRFDGLTAAARHGFAVAGGDFNADGYADLVVGAPSDDNAGSVDEGSASVYFGNTVGRPMPAQTFDFVNLSLNPIEQWGASSFSSYFTVGAPAIGVKGRERGKLQIEACRTGLPFGNSGCSIATTSSWSVLTANGTDMIALPQVGEGLYRWRARVQYLPATGTQPGITPPTRPQVSPWRRLRANADVQDVRVIDTTFKNGFE